MAKGNTDPKGLFANLLRGGGVSNMLFKAMSSSVVPVMSKVCLDV